MSWTVLVPLLVGPVATVSLVTGSVLLALLCLPQLSPFDVAAAGALLVLPAYTVGLGAGWLVGQVRYRKAVAPGLRTTTTAAGPRKS